MENLNTINRFFDQISKQSRAVVVNPNKVDYIGIDLGYLIKNTFKKSADSLKKINLKKSGDKTVMEFVFNSSAPHKVRIDFEEASEGNYLFTLLADSKGVRIKARIRDIDDKALEIFFRKLDHALYLIDKKYTLDEMFNFDNHKEVINLLDTISKLIIY